MNELAINNYLQQDTIKQKLSELLGARANAFTTSIVQIVQSNSLLVNATPESVFNAACVAATLDLPINNNLGFAYIVPFNNRKTNKQEAQFQIGYKGFIQLAQRSGQFKRINACATYSSDTDSSVLERLTSLLPKQPVGDVTGYIAYFELLNGYVAHYAMTIKELEAHSKKYSQTAKKGFGVWADNFDAMAIKTVLKLLLSKQAPLSIEMQKAVTLDQAVIKDVAGDTFEYVDNQMDKPKATITDEMMVKMREALMAGKYTPEALLALPYSFSDKQKNEIEGFKNV